MRASICEKQDQFSLVLQLVRGRAKSIQSYPLCLRWYQVPYMSTQTVACIRALNPDMSPSSSPVRDITMAQSCNEDNHFRQLRTAFTSLDMLLSTGHEPSGLSLFSQTILYICSHNSTTFPTHKEPGVPMFSTGSPGLSTLCLYVGL